MLMSDIPPLHVIIRFGTAIPDNVQGDVMLAMERRIRETWGIKGEVFKETMVDDSKLRRLMTAEQRAKL